VSTRVVVRRVLSEFRFQSIRQKKNIILPHTHLRAPVRFLPIAAAAAAAASRQFFALRLRPSPTRDQFAAADCRAHSLIFDNPFFFYSRTNKKKNGNSVKGNF